MAQQLRACALLMAAASNASGQVLLLANIRQLVTLRSPSAGPGPRRGPQLKDLEIIENGAVLCAAGKIVSVGKTGTALRSPWVKQNRRRLIELDCRDKVVLPGFVDSHTHPAFSEPRLADFEARIAGKTYEEIALSGGGIRSSVDAVRSATRIQLSAKILATFNAMARHGTTTVEAKSGYGLDLESEIKSLQAIREAAGRWPGTVVPTLMAAHTFPQEFQGHEHAYVTLICQQMIPLAARQKLARFVDVFCERNAFSIEEARVIFAAAARHSLAIRAHIGQLSQSPLLPLLDLNPASLDHLDHISESDIERLAWAETVATFLPGANYFLGLPYPQARKLIDAGVAIALATDFNPGSSPTLSMSMVLSLACTHMKMSPAEAITAATYNGACALRLQASKGSIEPGKDADMAVFDAGDYREIPYWFGADRCTATILHGNVIQ